MNNNNLITNINILRRLFPNASKEVYSKLKIDFESKMYISTKDIADKITQIIKNKAFEIQLLPSKITITDMTASVGGDVISFANNFRHVNAIEIDKKRIEYLTNNLNCYSITNVNLFNQNSLDVIFELEHDIVYMDPPWGGSNYKENKTLKLHLMYKGQKIRIEDICNDLMDKTKNKKSPSLIILKLPINYNMKYLMEKVNSEKIFIHDIKKMYIISIINK
jgi:hypothetical protein